MIKPRAIPFGPDLATMKSVSAPVLSAAPTVNAGSLATEMLSLATKTAADLQDSNFLSLGRISVGWNGVKDAQKLMLVSVFSSQAAAARRLTIRQSWLRAMKEQLSPVEDVKGEERSVWFVKLLNSELTRDHAVGQLMCGITKNRICRVGELREACRRMPDCAGFSNHGVLKTCPKSLCDQELIGSVGSTVWIKSNYLPRFQHLNQAAHLFIVPAYACVIPPSLRRNVISNTTGHMLM